MGRLISHNLTERVNFQKFTLHKHTCWTHVTEQGQSFRMRANFCLNEIILQSPAQQTKIYPQKMLSPLMRQGLPCVDRADVFSSRHSCCNKGSEEKKGSQADATAAREPFTHICTHTRPQQSVIKGQR